MANPAPAPKALGTPPEPFDGAASKAETFLSALQNYYYLNEALYNTQSQRVAAALSHFKVGTAAGEWAHDKQNAALTANPIDYGTWDVFIDSFKKHFICYVFILSWYRALTCTNVSSLFVLPARLFTLISDLAAISILSSYVPLCASSLTFPYLYRPSHAYIAFPL
jgi:hypothetical protein